MMKKFNVDKNESKRILLMHKALLKEQPTPPPTQDPIELMNSYIKLGCLTGGTLKRDKSTGKVFYRKESVKNPENIVRFFSDLTFTVTDKSGKVVQTAKWNCNKYQNQADYDKNEIDKLKQDNWKTRDDLKNVPDDQLNDPNLYKKHQKYDLYKSIVDINAPSKYTDRQKAALEDLAQRGFYPRNEFNPGTVSDGNCHDVTKFYPNEFSVNQLQVCYLRGEVPPGHKKKDQGQTNSGQPAASTTTGTAATTSTTATPTQTNQQTGPKEAWAGKIEDIDWVKQQIQNKSPKGFCKDLSKIYYEYWRDTQAELTQGQFMEMKRLMQQCVDQHNFRKNIFSKSDNYVRIMTGMEPGKGPGQDPDKKDGRVWLLTARRN